MVAWRNIEGYRKDERISRHNIEDSQEDEAQFPNWWYGDDRDGYNICISIILYQVYCA